MSQAATKGSGMDIYRKFALQRQADIPRFERSTIHPLYLPSVIQRTDFTWRGLAVALKSGDIKTAEADYCREMYRWIKRNDKSLHDSWMPKFIQAIDEVTK